jgi:hypothetical protein
MLTVMKNIQSISLALSPSACIVGGFTVIVLTLAHWVLALLKQRHVEAGETNGKRLECRRWWRVVVRGEKYGERWGEGCSPGSPYCAYGLPGALVYWTHQE